jgi:hypothetical protein
VNGSGRTVDNRTFGPGRSTSTASGFPVASSASRTRPTIRA